MTGTAWMVYHLYQDEGEEIRGTCCTNDDNDDGYPDGKTEEWNVTYKNREEMLRHTGGSHFGCSGIEVKVYLNGEKIPARRS